MLDLLLHRSYYHYHRGVSDSAQAKVANQRSRSNKSDLFFLQHKVERLTLITEALWDIVKKSHKLDDKYLVDLVKTIDKEDGKADGRKAKKAPAKCSNCKRTLTRHQYACMYCGTEHDKSLFDS